MNDAEQYDDGRITISQAHNVSGPPTSKALDEALTNEFQKLTREFRGVMLARLSYKQAEGFTGWDVDNGAKTKVEGAIRIKIKCEEIISKAILGASPVGKGRISKECVDIANLAMFIWNLSQDAKNE